MPTLDIYFIAIGGTGMAPLACLLKEQGHRVRGSDGPLYPPMSTLLADAGIVPHVGFDASHLDPRPDLVVVGNAVPRHNVEATEVERLGLARVSMPEALSRFFLADRRPLVVSGTHGKTTTSAMASWVYAACGADPGFLVGGVPRDFPRSFRVGTGPRFIVEGDEYNAAYFDRQPKFLHYHPHTLILTSVEYDHADLYPSPQALRDAYAALIRLLPVHGLLIANGDDPDVRALAEGAACPVVFYGLGEDNDVHPVGPLGQSAAGTSLRVVDPQGGESEYTLALPGEHNVANSLAVWTAARMDSLPANLVAAALGRFSGVKRRIEEIGEADGVLVVDDFAHHPTAVAKTLGGLRQRYPGRRIVVLFEPRSLTAGRSFFFDAYVDAFQHADAVLMAPIFHAGRLAADEKLDLPALVARVSAAGTPARELASHDAVLAAAAELARPGDVLVTMSSGDFGGMPRRLLEMLARRRATAAT